jgi:exosortase B
VTAGNSLHPPVGRTPAATWFPRGADPWVVGTVIAGLLALYLPVYWGLAHTVWVSDEQGQGPIILLAALWLLYQRRDAVAALPDTRTGIGSVALLAFGLLLYAIGHSQGIWLFSVGSQIVVFAALLAVFKGPAAVRLCWFPLLFLIFMVPLPGPLVAAVTAPLKLAVSVVASEVMVLMGYPVARSGVLLMVGQYQLLVADACAGLTSMFTLEALGLLYLNMVQHASKLRNAIMVVAVVPIAFIANVVRVIVLTLVTYHFGDAAGQGFVHSFAGLLLFVVAFLMVVGFDTFLGLVMRRWRGRTA